MRETVNTAISSGTGPDVIFYDAGPGYAGVLADAGLLLPLDDYAAQYGWNERIAAPALEATTIDGTLLRHAAADRPDRHVLQQDPARSGRAGGSDDARRAGRLLWRGDGEGLHPDRLCRQPRLAGVPPVLDDRNQMLGPEAMRALLLENEGRWDTPEITKAIESYFVTLRDAGCFPEDPLRSPTRMATLSSSPARPCCTRPGRWLVGEIETNMPDQEVGFVPFPVIEEGKEPPGSLASARPTTSMLAPQHPDEAAAFIDFLFSPGSGRRSGSAASRYFVPVDFDLSTIEIGPLTSAIFEALQTAGDEGSQFGYNIDVMAPPAFNEAMLNGFQAILTGDKTAEQLAAELQAAWEEGMPAAEATPAS